MKEKEKGKYSKTIVVLVEEDMWSDLRQIAFDRHMSMNELARMGMEKIISRYSKKGVDRNR